MGAKKDFMALILISFQVLLRIPQEKAGVGDMRENQPTFYFAGEAFDSKYQSYLQGAYRSGFEQANKILGLLLNFK